MIAKLRHADPGARLPRPRSGWPSVAIAGALVLAVAAPVAQGKPVTKLPSLTVDDVAVTEGHSGVTPAVFTVRLSASNAKPVSVDYATQDGSATVSGGDYSPVSGTLVFAKGQTSKVVTVNVNGDRIIEPAETLQLRLSAAAAAVIGDGTGQATIGNDDVPPPKLLTVFKDGTGNGAVTSSPAGIDCGIDCSESYPHETDVTLTATADADSVFTGWGGACSGTLFSDPCVVTMSEARQVVATFTGVSTLTLTCTENDITGACPNSSVSGCQSVCTGDAWDGETVFLVATPGRGQFFVGWTGACSGNETTCSFVVNGDASVEARFSDPL